MECILHAGAHRVLVASGKAKKRKEWWRWGRASNTEEADLATGEMYETICDFQLYTYLKY